MWKRCWVWLTAVGLMTQAASAANVLLNPGFEEGYSAYWTRSLGFLDGTGLGEEPHSGMKSWHGAWNYDGSAQTTRYYQDIPVLPGTTCSASMWCKADAYGGAYGNDTHSFRLRMRFRDFEGNNLATYTVNSPVPDNTWQQLVIGGQVAPPNTAYVRLLFFYITTQPAHAWKVWNIDDLVLDTPNGDQHVVIDISPVVIPDNTANTSATITGARLNGVSSVKLVKDATELVGGNIVVAGDGKSLTVDFPTTGAPYGDYDVIVDKPGCAPAFIHDGLRIRDPGGSWLLNGDFETGDLTGWQVWYNDTWGGDPAIEHVYVSDASDLFIHVPKVNGVDTPVFGQYSLRIGEYQENGGEGGVLQHVPVLGSEDLSLAWKWGGGNTVNPSAVEVAVLKGSFEQGWSYLPEDVLGLYRLNDPVGFGWSNGSLSFTVPPGEDTITVYAKVWHNPAPNWNNVALWLDEMTLTLPDCPDQHELSGIDPTSGDATTAFDLTVYGSNMDKVTSIRLSRGLDQIPGVIQPGADFDHLVAHFVPPGGGATLGDYDVVTEQEGCLGRVLGAAFSFSCNTASSLTGIETTEGAFKALTKPQGVVQMTVSGTNVDLLDEVRLVWAPEPRDPPGDRAPYWLPVVEITGAVDDASDPDNVVMSFDLMNAQAGMYELVGVRHDTCGDPNRVPDAFELVLPTGNNALVNGDFEADQFGPWVLTPDAGNTLRGDPIPGAQLAFTQYLGDGNPSNIGFPQIPGISAPYSGDEVLFAYEGNYGVGLYSCTFRTDPPSPYNAGLEDATWVSPNRGKLTQSLGLPNGAGQYALVLSYWVKFWDELWPHTSLTATILIDGSPASSVTAAFPEYGKASQDGLDAYTQLSVDYIGPAFSDISVEFYFQTDYDGRPDEGGSFSSSTAAIMIDNVELVGIITCPDPFADADGDHDVDHFDFARFQLCFTGPGTFELPEMCFCFDRDLDGDVDQADKDSFEACASGPGVEANPACDD